MGNAQSELQHIANALSGMAGDEKKFIEAVLSGNTIVSTRMPSWLGANPHSTQGRVAITCQPQQAASSKQQGAGCRA